MDYATDTQIEEAIMKETGQNPEVLKRPEPTCMREHLDCLQNDTEELRKSMQIIDQRMLQLEKIVGV